MAIKSSQGFELTSNEPIDVNLALTKAQMKNINENTIPDKYFTICQDDGKLYLYDKNNTVDTITGKFRVQEGGSGGGTVDTAMSSTSTNAVQNRVIKEYVDSQAGDPNAITNAEIDTIIFGGN